MFKSIVRFIGALVAFFILIVAVAIWPIIKAWGDTIMWVFIIGLVIAILGALITVGLRVYDWLSDMFANSMHDRQMKREEHRLKKAEVDKAEAEAEKARVLVLTAPADHQVYFGTPKNTQLTFRPGHLSPGNVNGIDLGWTPEQFGLYQFWNDAYAKRQTQQPALAPSGQAIEVLTPALDLILKAERRLITGPSGSGKTSLAKHVIFNEWMHGIPTIPIDPHHEGERMLGFPVIGAGRNYEQVADAIETLYWAMDGRYKMAAKGLSFSQFDTWHIIIDELTAILNWCSKNRKEVSDYLATLVIEARKVKIRLTILGHSHNVSDLGLSGPIRESLSAWKCTGGNDKEPGPVIKLETKNNRLVEGDEYGHPGPFQNADLAKAVIVDIAEPKKYRAKSMWSEGKSPTHISRILWGSTNGKRNAQVREWCEE